ncbi:MAG: YraN family protein [Capsulimonadales bacterium]|nr:YraN family protein [Capsulimonadales bacterium]
MTGRVKRRASGTGSVGEGLAQEFLERAGYCLIDTNIRFGSTSGVTGELDIVAWDGPTLCFLEVKTRRASGREGSPAAAVSAAKQRQLTRLATAYALRYGFLGDGETPMRFDVVSVTLWPNPDRAPVIRLLRGAFPAADE